MGFRRIDWQQKRSAFDGSIQWKPSSTLTLTGEALISKATPHDLEYAVGDYSQPETNNSTYQFADNGALVSGVVQTIASSTWIPAPVARTKSRVTSRSTPSGSLTITGRSPATCST